jgi:CheY-like chemotaxis protein
VSDNSVRILVVEDNQKHISDAVAYVSRLENCNVDFATTLAGAVLLLEANKYNGIISDVFFPDVDGASADSFENAISLHKKALELNTHVVFNTDGNHHGVKYRPFVFKLHNIDYISGDWKFTDSGLTIESYPKDENTNLDFKQWEAAFRYILLVYESKLQSVKLSNPEGEYLYSPFVSGDYGQLTQKFRDTKDPFALSVFSKYST